RLIALTASAASFGAEAGLAFVFGAFLTVFFAVFLAAFFATFLAAFFATFFVVFLAVFARFLATADLPRLAALAFFFFEDFLATAKILQVNVNATIWESRIPKDATASRPQASRTLRKPAVFVPDCNPGCRARRGRSFPIPPPAVQGGAGSHWHCRAAVVPPPSDRRCRQRPRAQPGRWCRAHRQA